MSWETGLLEFLVKSVVLQVAVLLGVWALRRSSAAFRHLLLAVGVTALLILPLLDLALPEWNLGWLPRGSVSNVLKADTGSPSIGGDELARNDPAGRSGTVWPQKAILLPYFIWFLGVWIAGLALILCWRLTQWLLASRLTCDSVALDMGELEARFSCFLEASTQALELRVSDRINVPGVQGLIRPRLILPRKALEWPLDRLHATVLHELAHVSRRDLILQLLAQVACAFYWFNPLIWILERKLMIERERACDDYVLQQNVPASEYAEHLLLSSEELGPLRQPVWATTPMAEGTDFKDRILSILDPNADRNAPGNGMVLTVLTLSALFIVPFSSLTVRAAQEPPAVTRVWDVRAGQERTAGNHLDIDFLALYLSLLKDPDPAVREHAATALKDLGDRKASAALVEALSDENATVREHVATALGYVGDEESLQPLAGALEKEADPVVKEHILSAMERIRKRQ